MRPRRERLRRGRGGCAIPIRRWQPVHSLTGGEHEQTSVLSAHDASRAHGRSERDPLQFMASLHVYQQNLFVAVDGSNDVDMSTSG